MHHHPLVRGATVAMLVLSTTAGALAGQATDQLKPQIDQVIATIDDPALRAESRAAERRQAIRAITEVIFDWTEMARRSMGRHWEERTVAEQTEFVALFRELMERAFFGKIERYGAENVDYVGESPEGDETTVRTLVTLKPGLKVAVNYLMARQGTRWVIYDVAIQAISLVGNYRTQFESILKSSPYSKLLKKLRDRVS